jgi:hypothetical protein
LRAKLSPEGRPPRHELKTEPVVEHREAAASQRDPVPIDAGHVLTVG